MGAVDGDDRRGGDCRFISCHTSRLTWCCGVTGLAALVCVAIISQANMAHPQELVNSYENRILTRDGTIDLKYDEKVRVTSRIRVLLLPVL